MNKNILRPLSILLSAAVAAAPARAAFTDAGVSARSAGMGRAVTASADDVYAVEHNPAGLGALERPELGTTYSRLLTGLSDKSNLQNSFVGYAHPLDGGRRGTLGAAWSYFSLNGLYRETTLYGSYARALWTEAMPDKLLGGVSVRVLQRSLGGTSEAGSAISNTGIATGTPDPVLQDASKTAFDADLGVLYRPAPRWTVGAAAQHLLAPDVSFTGSGDKVGRGFKLGTAYKNPFSTLGADLRLQAAPDGSMDKIFAAGAEKWLPTLLHGSFGVRGALSIGSRDHRQVSMGLSYKLSRMQFDYGFGLPIGGLTGGSGSHRLGLTVRFGKPRQLEATIGEALLESLPDFAAPGTPEFKYQVENLSVYKRVAIDELLRQAKGDSAAGRFADAAEKLRQAQSLKPNDERLTDSKERAAAVAAVTPELRAFTTDPAEAALYEGIQEFFGRRDKEALRRLAHAAALKSDDARAEGLMAAVEAKSGLKRMEVFEAAPSTAAVAGAEAAAPSTAPAAGAPSVPAAPVPDEASGARKVVEGLDALAEVAMREKEYERVISLSKQTLELDAENAAAYKRLGAAHYALKQLPAALTALRSAYRYETDEVERARVKSYLDALAAILAKKPAAPAAAAKPASASLPQDVERLYELGVELYAQGRLNEAAETFKRALALDPNNTSARRALDRVNSEIMQRGGAR